MIISPQLENIINKKSSPEIKKLIDLMRLNKKLNSSLEIDENLHKVNKI